MAHFFKRGSTWTYSADIGKDKNGNRKKQLKGGFRTKKEAQEAAAQLLVDLAQNTFVIEKDITFRDFAQDWLKNYSLQVKILILRNTLLKYREPITIPKIIL